MREIGLRKALGGFFVKGVGVSGIATALGAAAQPVQSVNGVGGNGIPGEKRGEALIGVRLFVEKSDPGDAPLGVVGVLAVGKCVHEALIKADGFGAIEEHPIIISGSHERFFGPDAMRIFLPDGVERGEHLGFFFFGAVGLREAEQAFGIHFRIRGCQRGQNCGRALGMKLGLGYAQQGELAFGISGITQRGRDFFKFAAGIFPFVSVKNYLRTLRLHFQGGRRVL